MRNLQLVIFKKKMLHWKYIYFIYKSFRLHINVTLFFLVQYFSKFITIELL